MFVKWFEEVLFYDPFSDFRLKKTGLEVRIDPITGDRARILDISFKPPDFDVEKLVEGTEKDCPFCPDRVERLTPRFHEEFIPEGRLKLNGLFCFPNVVSYSKYSSVVVATPYHFKKAHEIESDVLLDAFTLSIELLSRVARHDPSVNFFSVNWNFLYPAGASLAHPHLQTMADRYPSVRFKRIIDNSFAFFSERGRSLFDDYVESELSSGERFLKSLDGIYAFLSFAPLGAMPDVVFIFKGTPSLYDVRERLPAFIELFKGVLERFYENGVFSFNFSLYLSRNPFPFYTTYARLVPRIYPRPVLNSDVNFVRMMQDEGWVLVKPESMRDSLQPR